MFILEKKILDFRLPKDVSFEIENNIAIFKGKIGFCSFHVNKFVSLNIINNDQIEISVVRKEKTYNKFKLFIKSIFGLYNSLIKNAIYGVVNGFSVNMELRGLGYKVEKKDNNLIFSLGYSHPKIVEIPSDIVFNVDSKTTFNIFGASKQRVFWFASKIKALRKRNIYKGFGIFFKDEQINLKEVNKK